MKITRFTVVLLALFIAASALARMSSIPATPSSPALTSARVGSWSWSDPSAWSPAGVPADGAVIDIPAGSTVTLSGNSARIKWIQVEGTLALSSTSSSRLTVETLFIDGSGQFNLTPALPQIYTANIVFTSSGLIDTNWDSAQISRGLIAEGRVTIAGAAKTPAYAQVVADVPHGTSTITLDAAPSTWQQGDDVVLTGTYFRRNVPLQDERRKIVNINGKVITVDSAFTYDHLRVSSSMNLHLANLTRNVIFSSETTANTYDRGHVMLENRYTDVENAAFVNLGRTDKRTPLDDVIFKLTPSPHVEKPTAAVNNHRGRYAVHVHETEKNIPGGGYMPWGDPPATPPTIVTGCVVDGALSWGFVNHSSYVAFENDVAYNFAGAGFVTEGGDELGTFKNDIAIHGTGDGMYRKVRLNFGNAARPQPIADTAFSGHGFWFAGPALWVSNIVANSCNGDGVLWHPTGTVDTGTADAFAPPQTGYPNGRYHFFPRNWIKTVYAGFPGYSQSTFAPRMWVDPANGTDHILTADLPILHCDNVDSYANLIGFRPRFSNHDDIAWYNETPAGSTTKFGYDSQIIPVVPGDNTKMPTRLTQTISALRLWNNEEAIGLRYVDKTAWNGVTEISRLDHDTGHNPGTYPNYAMEMFFNVVNQQFNNLTIDGYELGAWTSDGQTTASNTTFTSPVYLNYATTGTWDSTLTYAAPGVPAATVTSPTAANVTWTVPSTTPSAYLLRYRAVGEQQWRFVRRTTNSASLTNLNGGKTYQLQVDAGFNNAGLSNWINGANFTTPACSPLGIATQPSSNGVQYGTTATLSVTPSGSGPFSYEWYLGNSGDMSTQIGTNSSTYTTPQLTSTFYCWARVTSACGNTSVNSNTAVINVWDYTPPPVMTRVQAATGTAWSQSSITVNWQQPTSAGNLLVAVISASNVSVIGSFTPPSGWLLAKSYDWNNIKTAIYYIPNCASGRTSETFSVPNYPDLTLQLVEYSGMATTNPLDQTAFDGDNATRSGTASSGTTANTSQPKELVITALTIYAQTAFSNPTNLFAELSDLSIGWSLTTATYERFVSAQGAYGMSANAGASAQWVGLAVAFRSADTQ